MSYSPAMQPGPDPDSNSRTVRNELQRIIAGPQFENADRLIRFLTFVVEEALAGRGDSLKESLIGVEVFGRATDYDPKVDPIVRVQARRLRAKLDTWYESGGQASTIRISLPKGGYAPEFGPAPAPVVAPAPELALQPVTGPTAAARNRPTTWIWLAAAAAIILLGTGAIALIRPGPKPAAAGSRLFTAYRGYQTNPAFSPDGKTLAFHWGGPDGDNTDIYVQSLDADAPRRLTSSPQRERNPVWLPDGQHIGFLRDDGPDQFAVIVVPLLGGGEKHVAEIRGNPGAPPRIEWSRDGKSIYTSEPPNADEPLRIVAIDLESGARRGLVPALAHGPAAGTPGDDEVTLSPDGAWLAFRRRTASVVGDVFIAPASGGEARAITHDRTGITGLAWTRDGRSLIVSSQRESGLVRLWRFPLRGEAPVCLTDAMLAASYPAVSPRDGEIAFASRYFDTNVWRVDLQHNAPPTRLIASNLLDSSPQYSPDGKSIVFRSNRTGSDEIWTSDAAGHSLVKLTDFRGPVTGSPHWSPDGQYVVFDSRPDGSADVFIVPAGGGRARKVTVESSNDVTPSFSSDGKWVYFASDRTGSWQIWKQPVGGGTALQITASGGFAPQESPDGQWLYYAKLDANGLFRRPITGGSESLVSDGLPSSLWGGWAVTAGKIVLSALREGDNEGPGYLKVFELETGLTKTVASLPFAPARWDGSVALSPDGRYALVTQLERQGSEIHLQADR
ncbi:MAG TPA: hypothetical protein VKU19_36830 [Bryobacteraceae bacterium]|nr:hypothetical protein [Bryobacteraceae bacterium]